MPLEYWEQVVYHPSATMKTSDLLKESDEKILEILDGVMEYRYGDFEPEFIQIMELDKLAGKKVLEIGAGCGTDAVKMTILGANVTAVDVLLTNVAVIDKNFVLRDLPRHTVYVKDIMELNIVKDYSVLYSFGCLHHIKREKVKEIFEHLLSFLKPEATILLMMYTKQVARVNYYEGDIVEYYNEEEIRDLLGDKVEILELSTFHGGDYWKIKGKLKEEKIVDEEKPITEGAILQLVTDEGEQIIKLGEIEQPKLDLEKEEEGLDKTKKEVHEIIEEIEEEDKRYEIEPIEEIVEITEVELPKGEDYTEDVKEQFDFLFKKKKEE